MSKSQNEKIVLYSVLLLYAAMDGWRDAWINHDWFERHIVKWIAYFSLPIYVLWTKKYFRLENLKKLLWLSAGGFFFWELFYTAMQ